MKTLGIWTEEGILNFDDYGEELLPNKLTREKGIIEIIMNLFK